jgi:amino acid adenylation domain-containing protein
MSQLQQSPIDGNHPSSGFPIGTEKYSSTGRADGAQSRQRQYFIPEMISAQAAAAPNGLALTDCDEALTYEQLEMRSSRVARLLRSYGVGPDVLVAVCLGRSVSLPVAELGILKAGGAYVPLDITYPPERLRFMLNDSQTPVLVTEQQFANRLPAGSWRVLNLDGEDLPHSSVSVETTAPALQPEQLAYVIYTSGSTGQPKGVAISQSSLLNLVLWHQRAFGVTPADRASQQASPSFDAAVWELWPYLAAGASVHFCPDVIRMDPRALRDWLLEQRITLSFVPTGLTEQMMALDWPSETPLRTLLTGADALRHFPAPGLPFAVVNNYGPTECTVVTTSGRVEAENSNDGLPPIGLPIDHCRVHILDDHMNAVPTGDTGEIYIGGACVGRGYINRPDLTAERFLPDPFSANPHARLYRTGDLGKYLPDGQIAFMGRADDQLKIRGFRIEPNEIVSVLGKHPSVSGSAVVAREDSSGEKQLVAYIVAVPEAKLTSSSLREYLHEFVPDYAIPSLFVQLEQLPLTRNGKLDRAALPPPESASILREAHTSGSATELEQQVAGILSQLLDVETVGVNDNFFLLGGHSLLGTRVIARVRENFGVNLPLRTIFEAPTAAELAAEIDRALRAKVEEMTDEEAERALEILSAAGRQGE